MWECRSHRRWRADQLGSGVAVSPKCGMGQSPGAKSVSKTKKKIYVDRQVSRPVNVFLGILLVQAF